MKKIIALILAMTLALGLTGCGGSDVKESGEIKETAAPAATEAQYRTVDFEEPIVIFDDEHAKIELVGYFEEFKKWSDKEPAVEKCFAVKATNKTDHKLIISLEDIYLGADGAKLCMLDGSITPAPGKNGVYRFIVWKQAGTDYAPLDALEEMDQLGGTVDVLDVYDDSSKNKSYETPFSFAGMPEQPEPTILALGETASTEDAEFTMTEFEFVDALNRFTGSGVLARDLGLSDAGLVAGDNIYAKFKFDYTNLAKEDVRITDAVTATVDYRDGYLYSTEDGLAYCFDSTGFYNSFKPSGYVLELVPLGSGEFRICIPVPKVVRDEAAPLSILITLHGGSGDQTFRYTIR